MRIDLKKIGAMDRRIVVSAVLGIAGLALCLAALNVLRTRSAAVDQLRADVEGKEQSAQGIQIPTAEETASWMELQNRVSSVLLSDSVVPLVYEEVARVANQHSLQRVTINTEERPVGDASSGNPIDVSLQSLGVRRYLAITVNFRADYRDAAGFVGEISRLPRSLAISSATLRRDPPLVDGTVVIYLYKRGAA